MALSMNMENENFHILIRQGKYLDCRPKDIRKSQTFVKQEIHYIDIWSFFTAIDILDNPKTIKMIAHHHLSLLILYTQLNIKHWHNLEFRGTRVRYLNTS